MSNDVKLELCPFCGGPAQIIAGAPGCYYVRCEGCSVTSDDGSRERVITKWNTRHQPQREAVLEEALLQCASRFSAYAELHAEKLWDGSLSEAQRQTVRDKVDRNLRYAAEARAALKTTPAPAECPSCHGLNTSCPEGCGRDPETGELNGTLLAPTDQALLADIFAKMEEVLKPLPGELPNALGDAGTRATESGDGDS